MIHPTVNTRQTENGSDDSDESDDDSSYITIKLVDPVFDRFKKTMGDRYELETFGKALRRPGPAIEALRRPGPAIEALETFYRGAKHAQNVLSLKTFLTDTYELCCVDIDEFVKDVFEAYQSALE